MLKSVLKILRKANGLTQKELAEELQVPQSSVSVWESGKSEPNIEGLKKLSDYYKVTIDYLLELTPNKKEIIQIKNLSDLSDGVKELLTLYQKLSEEKREELLEIAKMYAKKENK